MVTTTCDVCKKKVDDPVTNCSFFYYAETSLCEACKDNLEVQLKANVRGRDPFSFEWYGKVVGDTCGKSKSKGR